MARIHALRLRHHHAHPRATLAAEHARRSRPRLSIASIQGVAGRGDPPTELPSPRIAQLYLGRLPVADATCAICAACASRATAGTPPSSEQTIRTTGIKSKCSFQIICSTSPGPPAHGFRLRRTITSLGSAIVRSMDFSDRETNVYSKRNLTLLTTKPQVRTPQMCELTRCEADLPRPGRSGRTLGRVRRAGAVEQGGASGVARLQRTKVLLVAISHDLTDADRMVETDRVADFVSLGVTQIMTVRSPSKPIFQRFAGLRQIRAREMGLTRTVEVLSYEMSANAHPCGSA